MITEEYRANRARFPQAELGRYCGRWVAFSADGRRIVASGNTIEQLEQCLVADGGDPSRVVFERLAGSDEDSLLGAGEWM